MNGFIKFLLILVILTTLGNLVNQVILWAPPVIDSETAGGNGGNGSKPENDNGNNNSGTSVTVGNSNAPYLGDVHVSATVEPDDDGKVPAGGVSLDSTLASATVPEGVQMEEGATELTLTVNGKEDSEADLDLSENEVSTSLDVHMAGVSTDNAIPMEIKLAAAAVKGLNSTSIKLYHVENGETVEMTRVANDEEFTEHNQFKYDPATGDVTLYVAGFSEIAMVADIVNAWNGGVDHSWYKADATELTIANADQLWSFSQIVGGMAEGIEQDDFKDKTVKLTANIDLGDKDDASTHIFYPIGYYNDAKSYVKPTDGTKTAASVTSFCGTFDGDGHIIANFYQNTWQMWGNYDSNYYKAAMGLFGYVHGGTIKNLTVDNFSSDGEFTPTGCIAAYADGDSAFENIKITNCNPRVYNTGNGGIIGIAGDTRGTNDDHMTLTNITVNNSNKISALWGSWDVACGGLVGMYRGNVDGSGNATGDTIKFTNCHVSAQIDVNNDVCANYQYYAYRYAGMMIGSVRHNTTNDEGRTIPNMTGITAYGCTVNFGTWNDYYYCELVANSLASYTHDHQMSRLVEVQSVDVENKTVTDLHGNTTAIPTSGRQNYVVVNYSEGHGTANATCYHFVNGEVWTHNMAGTETVNGVEGVLKEDKQHLYLEFNNLFTGYGWGVSSMAIGKWHGITVTDLDITEEGVNDVEKFIGISNNSYPSGSSVNIGDLFTAKPDSEIKILGENVVVTTTGTAQAEFQSGTGDWTTGKLKFSGVGELQITITDYYYCKATTITVEITKADKFDTKFVNHEKYLYRVGNMTAVDLGSIFYVKDDHSVNNPTISVTAMDDTVVSVPYTSNNSDWTKGTLNFKGITGVVKITIQDDESIPYSVIVEVVDAKNATTAQSATANNVVLLNDCTFGTIEVSGGYTLYGNGFTMTCGSDSAATNMENGFVTLENGALDNVQIKVPNFSHAVLYESNKEESGNATQVTDKTRYYNVYSAVRSTGNSKILNSYISGGRAAVYAVSGTLLVDNTTIEGGAAANMHINAACAVTLRDVTMIQEPKQATVHDTSKTLMGLSVVVICDGSGLCTAITLEGTLKQYAWAHEGYTSYVPEKGQSLIPMVLKETDYIHQITYTDGEKNSLNLGFVFLPSGNTAPKNPADYDMIVDNRSNKDSMPYGSVDINGSAYVYSYKNSNGTSSDVATKPTYAANKQAPTAPIISYNDTNENRVFKTIFDSTTGKWVSTLTVDVDAGDYTFAFSELLANKYGKNLSYSVKLADGSTVGDTVLLNSAVTNEYVLTITDDQIYDQNGILTGESITHTYTFKLLSTKTSLPAPTWTNTTLNGQHYIVASTKNSDWNVAVSVLEGLNVKYWSKKQNKEIELDLSTVVSAAGLSNGEQNGANNSITITVADEYTLTITSSGFKTNDNGKPVVVGGKLYFTVASSSNYVSTSTTTRTPTITYSFTDANNSDPLPLTKTVTMNYNDYKSNHQKDYNSFCSGTLKDASSGCITEGTLITLADGTQKPVEELNLGDMVLAFNHETGKFVPTPVIFNTHVDDLETREYKVLNLEFSNGKELEIVESHGLFDMTLMKYVYLDYENYTDFIGHKFFYAGADGTASDHVTLENAYIDTEVTRIFCPVTYFNMNSIANGFLNAPNSPYGIAGPVNYFDYDPDLKYNEEKMKADIEKYGLYTYEDFKDYMSEEAFNSSTAVYLKIAEAKGLITYEEIIIVINYLLEGSLIQ